MPIEERDTPAPPESVATAAPARPKRRWRRRLVILLIFLGTGLAILTRPSVLRRILEPTLAHAFGGDVHLENVSLQGLQTLHVGSMILSAPGWTGPAAEVVLAEETRIDVSLPSLLLGRVRMDSLSIGRLRVRAVERMDQPGVFNILELRPDTAAGDEPLRPLPVAIDRLELETGVLLLDGTYLRSGERVFRGMLGPMPNTKGPELFGFSLFDINGSAPILAGSWDERTFAFSAKAAATDIGADWLALAPSRIQRTAEALGFVGKLSSATLQWSPETSFQAALDIAEMRLNLPAVGIAERWSRVENGRRLPSKGVPTIAVKEGQIRFDGSRILLNQVRGELASSADDPGLLPVPVETTASFDLDLARLGSVDWRDSEARDAWMRELLRTMPFEIAVAIRGFDSSATPPGHAPVLEVPRAVAGALEAFGVVAWHLDVEATFSRSAPTTAADGTLLPARLESKGQAILSKGRGAYEHFPYPLEDVKAHISFDQAADGEDRITIDYLNGVGPAGTHVSVRGTVERPTTEARVDVTIVANDTPLDPQLFNCIEGRARRGLEMLLNSPLEATMRAHGLLDHPDDLPNLRAKALQLENLLGTTTDDAERTEIAQHLARVRRQIEARPFQVGGVANLEARVTRELGPDQPLHTSGKVALKRTCVMVEAFPYPLVVTSGTIAFDQGGVSIAEPGLEAVTLDGGVVRVTGRVDRTMIEGREELEPYVTVLGVGDRISPTLLAAIPPPDEEPVAGWPGAALAPAAKLLDAARLAGDIDFRCALESIKGNTTFQLDVALSNGSVDAVASSAAQLALPARLKLEDLTATLHVDEEAVTIRSLEGHGPDGGGTITVTGRYATHSPEKELDIQMRSMPIASWIPETLTGRGRDEARRAWDMLSPVGRFDAGILVESGPDGQPHVTATLHPTRLEFTAEGETTILTAPEQEPGGLLVEARGGVGRATLQNLTLESSGGRMGLDGFVDFGTDGVRGFRLNGRVTDVPFEHPLLLAVLRLAAGNGAADGYRDLMPRGRFDGRAHLARAEGQPLDWSATIEPKTFGCRIGDARPEASFAPSTSITVRPSGLDIRGLDATVDGERVTGEATVDLGSTVHRISADFAMDADRWTPAVIALLPPPLGEARKALGFAASTLELYDTHIDLDWDPNFGITRPLRYQIATTATTSDAIFDVGVPFSDVDGGAVIRFGYDHPLDGDPSATLDATLRASSLELYGRDVRDGTARLVLENGGRVLAVRSFDAAFARGRVAGEGRVDLVNRRYAADVRLAGAALGPLTNPLVEDTDDTGSVDGRLTVEGPVGDINGRTGRGRISIRNARMASAPITLGILQITQLMLPLSSSLSEANIEFFVRGPIATFERLQLQCNSLEFDGTGTLDTRDFSINATLRTRGRIPVVSNVLAAVSNQLYDIEITGPLADPRTRLRPLPVFAPSSNRSTTAITDRDETRR